MTIKTIHYALQGVDSQLFLRLFLDTASKKSSLLAHLEDNPEPARPWLGEVNIDKKQFSLRRLRRRPKKISGVTVRGYVDHAAELLIIRLSINLFDIIAILFISVIWGIAGVMSLESDIAYALGPCIFMLQLLLVILDYQKTMQLLENYLPAPVGVEAPRTIQQRRYLK